MSLPDTIPYIDWRWDDLVFLVLAGVLLGGATMVVMSRDIIRSGLFMILSFLGLAGIYALMGATLVAAAQVLIYIGAISVLILFAVMLTQSKAGSAQLVFNHQVVAAAVASLVMGALFVMAILFTTFPLAVPAPIEQSAKDVATLIFKDNVFAFEVVSLLLLGAVVGGIFLARRDAGADEGAADASPAGRAGGRGALTGYREEP